MASAAVTTRREHGGRVLVVTLHRPKHRNAVDGATARKLRAAFVEFERDPGALVAVLYGEGGVFCAGADLEATAQGDADAANPIAPPTRDALDLGPMGPTRLALSKPVIAAVEGFAVAGGLELALWCDLRVAGDTATFGVFCRRFGVPLIDGGTIRLPRVVGHGRAMDMILTGRPVDAKEALHMGLASRVVRAGTALREAVALAEALCAFPQGCMRNDRASAVAQWSLSEGAALAGEFELGVPSLLDSAREGAKRFKAGQGKGGSFAAPKL